MPWLGNQSVNRVELGDSESEGKDHYKRIVADTARIDVLIVALFWEQFEPDPETIILDLDTTDYLLHGNQDGKYYHGPYQAYCYLPRYITCGQDVPCCRLRPSHFSAAGGVVEKWNGSRIRSGSVGRRPRLSCGATGSFPRMTSCLGVKRINPNMSSAWRKQPLVGSDSISADSSEKDFKATGEEARAFRRFTDLTLQSWNGSRQVIGKAKWLPEGLASRFVMSNLNP